MAIQFRRGDYDDMDPNMLLDGEPCVTTQDDPNVSDGRGFYIKNGTLKRVVTSDELPPSEYTLIDEITLSSGSSNVSLFTTTDYDEYLIVINGECAGNSVGLLVGSLPIQTSISSGSMRKAFTIKKITGTTFLISIDNVQRLEVINSTQINAISSSFASGTKFSIYAR